MARQKLVCNIIILYSDHRRAAGRHGELHGSKDMMGSVRQLGEFEPMEGCCDDEKETGNLSVLEALMSTCHCTVLV
jgi:hypothetical protein